MTCRLPHLLPLAAWARFLQEPTNPDNTKTVWFASV